jgi:hypothetical protein
MDILVAYIVTLETKALASMILAREAQQGLSDLRPKSVVAR